MQTEHTLITRKRTVLTEHVSRNKYSTFSCQTLQCLDEKDKEYREYLHC